MTYTVMAYTGMAYVVMAYIVTAHIITAYKVMAYIVEGAPPLVHCAGPRSQHDPSGESIFRRRFRRTPTANARGGGVGIGSFFILFFFLGGALGRRARWTLGLLARRIAPPHPAEPLDPARMVMA